MWRWLAVIAACVVVLARVAIADTIETNVSQMGSDSYKVRLAATLALSKSKDARAVIALADAVDNDRNATIRRVSALALAKMIDVRTPEDARELGLIALANARRKDTDRKVRATATATLKALSGIPRGRGGTSSQPSGPRPPVFVNVDALVDQSRKLPKDTSDRVHRVVRSGVERTGYATSWPGGLPTSAELTAGRSVGFIVASTVKRIDITRAGTQAQIACTVAIRVAPWGGKDGGEKWEANKAASASGSAKATTGSRPRDIQSGVRDCIEAVAEDVTSRQVVPFLKRIATASP